MSHWEVDGLFLKARQSLDAAALLFRDDYIDFSAGRSYYAMFYSLQALMLEENKSFSKHTGTISAFGRDYVKEGVFEAKFHRYVLEAFDLRHTGDYGTLHAVPEDKAKELLKNAGEIIDIIRDYIDKKRASSS